MRIIESGGPRAPDTLVTKTKLVSDYQSSLIISCEGDNNKTVLFPPSC
jgi:hypothetical protein